MGQEKTRLKFRVTAHDGVSAGGLPEPRWMEKWGVGLFDYEEFHVTDQLLKLPFREAHPKTVCVFSIVDGVLAFRMLDEDRRAEVNGVDRREARVTIKDKIRIGESLVIEVMHAPPKARAKGTVGEPSLGKQLGGIPKIEPEDGPTLTFAPTGMTEAAKSAIRAHTDPKQQVPPIATEPTDVDVGHRMAKMKAAALAEARPEPVPDPAIPPSPVFKERSRSVEIPEPSLHLPRRPKPKPEPTIVRPISEGPMPGMVPEEKVQLQDGKNFKVPPRPASLSGPGPMPGMLPEEKVELAKRRGPIRAAGPEEPGGEGVNDGIDPYYAEEADLSERPTFAERILAAIAKILHRDDVNPPEEPFPVEEGEAPWVPEGIADPGISRMSSATYGKTSTKIARKKEKKKKNVVVSEEETRIDVESRIAWIPAAISAAARIRGRAIIFLLAAIGTLMIAVGVFRIQNRVSELESNRKPPPAVEPMSEFAPSRGIPIEIIVEKVRRMRSPTPRPRR